MKRIAVVLGAALLLGGCEDSPEPALLLGPDGGGASTFGGTWRGDFFNSFSSSTIATMQLAQVGTSVTGTLTTTSGRTANVGGTLDGTRMTGSWTYTDFCGGSASTTADLTASGNRLSGQYTSNDCVGLTTGGYFLDRQP